MWIWMNNTNIVYTVRIIAIVWCKIEIRQNTSNGYLKVVRAILIVISSVFVIINIHANWTEETFKYKLNKIIKASRAIAMLIL